MARSGRVKLLLHSRAARICEVNMKQSNSGLVYSTESGRMCPECRQPVAQCACKLNAAPKGDGVVRVSRQSKGRGGKTVTLVKGLALDAAALALLGKALRTACGSGGTVKDGVIEIQGDHCELVMETLRKHGIEPKRAGG
jgi:translation initiation factor 1